MLLTSVTLEMVSPALSAIWRAFSRVVPVRVGTVTFLVSGPLLMTSFTVSPGLTCSPAAGSLEITCPSSTSSEASLVGVSTFKSICCRRVTAVS